MSIVDKAIGAITPPESDEARAKANLKARAAATPGDWLSAALEHHDQIRSAFEECRTSTGASGRQTAMKKLALVLNGHSLAEEVVLYPALAKAGERATRTSPIPSRRRQRCRWPSWNASTPAARPG